ncbi:hypothetical protein PMZ80_011148 [Knufia obscura]|uniref:C2H2-type domain-containing protein n=1 Tax=Knufia obscura TaxID=1635080 RepID=A0ABR0R8Q4_9EURO|nr:hypothetical protein PMZ80_011148 [Knufia obscura]
MYAGNPVFGSIDMRRIHPSGNDGASYGRSQSVATMSHHNLPTTPQTREDRYSDQRRYNSDYTTAKQQSLQDAFPDQNVQHPHRVGKINKCRLTLQEQFLKAQQLHLRTGSPKSNPHAISPFKPTSTLLGPVRQPLQQVLQPQKQETAISPKELMLDNNKIGDKQSSLFPQHSSFSKQAPKLSTFYKPPAFNRENSVQISQHNPFIGQSSSQSVPDSTPNFPAHLLSIESTNEEGPSVPSRQESPRRSQPSNEPVQRLANVSSSTGRYSCTYYGCPERFESPAKLQKHKREGHQQREPADLGPTVSPSLKSSQARPQRCDRMNPSTGRPCNSVFSRPYDLTRHEDTIHNARKQKVQCHLCTEQKTFSRIDALIRHMRVAHLDVGGVGKQKKRMQKSSYSGKIG